MKNDFLKFSSKRNLLSAMIICCLSFAFSSCDDEEGRIKIDDSAPAKVTNITATPGPGEVMLSWTNPSSSSFMYTKIEYTNARGEKKYTMVSKEKANENNVSTATIKGFANTNEQKFEIFACSVRGNNAGAVEVSQSPGSPAFLEVVKTVSLEPVLGGVLVNYENKYNSTILIALNFYEADNESKAGSIKFEAPANSKGPQLVMLTDDSSKEFLNGECIVKVSAEDEYDNASEAKELRATPIPAVKFDRSNWSFPGYNENSSDGTIGYSSQEAIGEGDKDGLKNGRVASMIDGSLNTYWHASWKTPSTSYPHWFILDMGKEVTIASVELTRRQGDARGQKGQIIYTCTEAGATDANNPDSWRWVDHGSFVFNPNIDVPQSCGLTTTPKARYIKVYFGTEHKGSGAQAMLADLNVYGAEE
ncbi:DUF4959 domain-containing protein [Bacteroides intestinalis]|jgi:hypothetical protein|uniref:DUF4959 domain-containing protein n=1 Tax=Bacteroides intestinalis TaxID=329854 RepID=UPI0022E617EF|nr:DUF4959 domain-containing protein [Bacteroides intestinalis]